jgi:hypothetical protein
MMRNRRGVSEMIAVVLLLIVVSIAGVFLYRSSLAAMSDQYTNMNTQLGEDALAAKERFKIVSIQYLNPSTVIAYVYSYTPDETVTATISSIYVDSVAAQWGSTENGKVGKNQIIPFTITHPTGVFTLSTKILLVSERGVNSAYP